MPKAVRISLANKCQLLFGAAVVLILASALAVVWVRMQKLVEEGQQETSRRLADAWLDHRIQLGGILLSGTEDKQAQGLTLAVLDKEELEAAASRDPFLAECIEFFQARSDRQERSGQRLDAREQKYFRYARAIRKSDLSRIRYGAAAGFTAAVDTSAVADPLQAILLIEIRSDLVDTQLALNRIYIVAAGLLAGLLAIGVFWFIITHIILSPVRVLTETASKVSEGDLNIRSDINTGDEFEQLSGMFNHMLENLKNNQDQLRTINKSLDLKLGELAEHNVALYEANKIKGEFLANVSHELRTPLNSIIGFAEVLQESFLAQATPVEEKRKRYTANIIISSRRLLDLITDLLDLAKIEAGRMELRVGPMSVSDTCEGLINLIRPQAEKGQIELHLKVAPNLPLLQTDAGKFQQVVFNFLSNAVKFTPPGGAVTLAASLTSEQPPRLKVSVSDTGPGIAPEHHGRIFEKFTQLENGVTRQHGGTGLGLTIAKELVLLLQGKIELESELGRGATFTVLLPWTQESRSVPLMPELTEQQGQRASANPQPAGGSASPA